MTPPLSTPWIHDLKIAGGQTPWNQWMWRIRAGDMQAVAGGKEGEGVVVVLV